MLTTQCRIIVSEHTDMAGRPAQGVAVDVLVAGARKSEIVHPGMSYTRVHWHLLLAVFGVLTIRSCLWGLLTTKTGSCPEGEEAVGARVF